MYWPPYYPYPTPVPFFPPCPCGAYCPCCGRPYTYPCGVTWTVNTSGMANAYPLGGSACPCTENKTSTSHEPELPDLGVSPSSPGASSLKEDK